MLNTACRFSYPLFYTFQSCADRQCFNAVVRE